MASATHPPSPLARRRQSLIVLRHVSIACFSAACWLDPVYTTWTWPVESDIASAIQSPSAFAGGAAANAAPIAIASAACLFMGSPPLFSCPAPLALLLAQVDTITRGITTRAQTNEMAQRKSAQFAEFRDFGHN
jgi:hypothetical protein